MSMAGMISMSDGAASAHRGAGCQPEEVLVHAQAGGAALLRVELRGHHVVAADHGGERHAVLRLPDDDRGVIGPGVVRVHEIEVRAVRDVVENRVWLHDAHPVPAHVGHLEAVRQAHHPAREDAQAGVFAALLTDVEQRLLAHAHTEEGSSAGDVLTDGRHHVVALQVSHRVGGCAYARNDEGVRPLDVAAAGGDQGLAPGVGDGARYAAEVAGPVVDDYELHRAYCSRLRLLAGQHLLHDQDVQPAGELVAHLALDAHPPETEATVQPHAGGVLAGDTGDDGPKAIFRRHLQQAGEELSADTVPFKTGSHVHGVLPRKPVGRLRMEG